MFTNKLRWCFIANSFAVLTSVATVQAAPWVDPGDERLRHHITVLADAGVITAPITTWPLMWGAVMNDIRTSDIEKLKASAQWSVEYVQFAFQQASNAFKSYSSIGWQSNPAVITDFGTNQREKSEVKSELDWVGHSFAARFRATWASNATDGKEARLDGSYMAAIFGNWSFGVGAIDRWWGPGWQNSNILSSNARPVPAVMLQRNFSEAFSWPVLNWLGPWTFTAFIGQLEGHRQVPEAKLVGARLAFKPIQNFEVGFSRTGQWGGDGRPEDFSSFWDLMVGNDNVGDDGIDAENQPGNQLGAIDLRLGGTLFETQSAAYLQYVGEDESNAFPSLGFYLVGLETAFATANTQHRIVLEYTDTTAGGDRYNTTYEHSVYQSGYRYRGRPLAASIDNDSEVITLAGSHFFANGNEFSWRLNAMDINQDGTNKAPPGGNVFGDQQTTVEMIELSYGVVFKDIKLSTALTFTSDELTAYGQTIDETGVSIAIEYKP